MLDIGWSELVLIGVVALIVVGPKDLPEMFRTLGRLTAKARMMARDFQRAMEDAADESGIKDISRDLNSIRSPVQSSLDAVNRKLDDWDERARATRAGGAKVSPPPDTVVAEVTPEEAAEIALPEAPDVAPVPSPAQAGGTGPAPARDEAPGPVVARPPAPDPIPPSASAPAAGEETKA